MNDQIKELVRRAGFIGENFQHTIFGTCQETALANFAELLIEECIHAVEHHGGMCGVASSTKIKEHFGVDN